MNTSGEGGRECAALATVFGVPEYVDSKVFWERQQHQNDNNGTVNNSGIINNVSTSSNNRKYSPSPNFSTSRIEGTSRVNTENPKASKTPYGSVAVNNISIFSKPLSNRSANEEDEFNQSIEKPDTLLTHLIDSAFGDVGSNELDPTFHLSPSDPPQPAPSKSFSLPKIPAVSKFNDLLIEDENGLDVILPANPSSIFVDSPMFRSESVSSARSVYTSKSRRMMTNEDIPNLPTHPLADCNTNLLMEMNEDEEVESIKINVGLIGTPELFDYIISDDDERFIIWGPDPIALSSSMATATTPSSYATLYNNQNRRPELKGFSSNTTELSRSQSHHTQDSGSKQSSRPSFASVRLSAWSETLRKHQTVKPDNKIPTSMFLKKAFGMKKNQQEVNAPTITDVPKVIEAASVHKLVEKLTNTLDYTFMTDFFLTYRDFLRSEDLCQLLILRFHWALYSDEETRKIVRIRTFVVLRHWLNNYFVHDFMGNYPLRQILTSFLNALPHHPLVRESPRDQRIVKILKRVVRRLKKLYYIRSSGASRVKVIPPPPPTEEEQVLSERVRVKLSQNAIRRKTALGVDMSGYHNGNMAVQDTRNAPVVVVGSMNMKGSLIDSGVETSRSAFIPVRRTTSQHSVPHDRLTMTTIEDNQTVKSLNHRYDRNVLEAPQEVASNTSVASDDSLESELSAGQTIPDESDDDDHSHVRDSYIDYNENELHWIREQQETMEYFNSTPRPMEPLRAFSAPPSTSAVSSIEKLASISIPEKTEAISDYSASSTPTTPTHLPPKIPMVQKEPIQPKIIRRVPSERWCKSAAEEDYSTKVKMQDIKVLPDELLTELSGEDMRNGKIPAGLSRKLSRKSIEKRKSERSLHDVSSAWSSAPSSANVSPFLSGVNPDDIPDVPELPPLTQGLMPVAPKRKSVKKKRSGLIKKRSISRKDESMQSSPVVDPVLDTFAAISYEETSVSAKVEEPEHQLKKPASRRKLTRALSKVFNKSPATEAEILVQEVTSPISMTADELPRRSDVESQNEDEENHKQKSRFVSLIAQQLRTNQSDDNDFEVCDCARCSGNNDSPFTCRRLSMLLIADDERRHSFELRRNRGASVDMDHHVLMNQMNMLAEEREALNDKDNKAGPVYLGHLQARSLTNSHLSDQANCGKAARPPSEEDSDDASSASYVPSDRSIQTEAQASSFRARRSYFFEPSAAPEVPRSKMIEIGLPSVSTQQNIDTYSLHKTITNMSQVLHTKPGRSFIMSYRTSIIASQFCFIERDVLAKVGWEELIHCNWTKMDPNGKINPHYLEKRHEQSNMGEEDSHINYTRQLEKKRHEEQGIEQVIQRFNDVCQWVSSEIVQTRNISERVKLIEKFIRLAKKCKMYSNYATLVQILLGLQSPAVARLNKTWAKVSVKCQKRLNKLTEFTSPMRNWKNIRDSMTEVAEEYGNSPAEVQVELPSAHRQKFKKTKIKIPFGGCIPFLGIYLSDLVFNSEKPRYLKPNGESHRIYNANSTRGMPECLNQPLVNFRKHRVIATVIKRVLIFQGLAARYSFEPDEHLIYRCQNLEILDAVTIRELSASLE
ncbi:hypothetical protein BDB01DRAFT_843016 [Pilobolus umbonatus]|nr:hypothetical protein BDB01DRAFT_843016 [Pilobolus umbonatus]